MQVKLSGKETRSVQEAARVLTQLLTQFGIFSLLGILFTVTVFSLIMKTNSYVGSSVKTLTVTLS